MHILQTTNTEKFQLIPTEDPGLTEEEKRNQKIEDQLRQYKTRQKQEQKNLEDKQLVEVQKVNT